MTGVILAVDGGNSKTDVVRCTVDGEVLGAVRGPTTSHQAVGLEAGLDRLAGLVAGTGAPVADLASCCLAGLDLASDEARLLPAYEARGFARETRLFNDTFAALRAG